jgi:anti-sigma B factor antagonist
VEVNVNPRDKITIVEIVGDVDGRSAPVAQEKILPLAGEDCKLVLDMSKVDYMSSAGLRVLLAVRRQVPASGKVVLSGLSEQLRETMAITGFLDFFTVTDTVEEAIAAVED